LPRIEYISPRMKRRNLITTQKGEESHKEDIPIGTFFFELEEEEEAEEVK
jgi:hypothetical protein